MLPFRNRGFRAPDRTAFCYSIEEANQGQTVIEKVENFADVPFAIVILSLDDVGRAATPSELE
jgi:hypothetical protein